MSWIEQTPPHQSDDTLKDLYRRCVDPQTGKVDNILAVRSLHSNGMAAHLDLYQAVMAGTPTLRKVERELLAFVVSQTNDCHY